MSENEESSKLPVITLGILLLTLVGLIAVGFEHFVSPDKDELIKAEKFVETEEEVLPEASQVVIDSTQDPADSLIVPKDSLISKSDEEELAEQKKEAEAEVVPQVAIPAGKSHAITVEKGETFSAVARHYGLKVDQLKALNPGVNPDDIKIGSTKLNVKIQAIHTVGPGDIMRKVAEKYGVSKQAIMDANHKKDDITLRGEVLIIPLKK
ncbi:LysM peptidoglycan-binding domain-containing protein [Aquirufa antheringensis]|jgi:LysM repeat protein|uniref:LysM peptidoglycan-binding domain-containing protein n=1 Tax=Aquirufa antheringensis TaxID=2516559 RepID=UPI0022A83464|nr:LysM peptidoglycan-binding domain-containing protein [Aquirufa antheringensis]MCZ2487628.1 LysM peptidoglycan-binding domain-containing protein [Aquirufa antheringensis]MCZ2489547.1 LysM peptidoglycan-binding domain-containing protein [Aquirufa antheringensis]